jgi:hypothetical protein
MDSVKNGGGEGAAHVSPPLPARTQRGPDDDLVDRASESLWRGDMDGYKDVFKRLQSSPAIPPGEISEALAPRIREFGLERNCRELWEQGYTVVEDVAPPEY